MWLIQRWKRGVGWKQRPCNVLWRVRGHGTLSNHRSFKSYLIREETLSAESVNMWWVLIRFVQAYGDLLSGLARLWLTMKAGGIVRLVCCLSLATGFQWWQSVRSECDQYKSPLGFIKVIILLLLTVRRLFLTGLTLHSTSASQEEKRH